jgi:UDP-glucose 4-epimerase
MAETGGSGKGLSVFITGAGGYIGRQLAEAMAGEPETFSRIIAGDIRLPRLEEQLPGITYLKADVRDPGLADILTEYKTDVVVHLAAVVTPGRKSDQELLYAIDVLGSENVLEGCRKSGVAKIVVSSSGAAYGYHPDNPQWITEDDPLRGNPEFAYSDHKRLVEEMLTRWRRDYPELKQLILRPGTILGEGTDNQITRLFDKPRILQIAGSSSPFVLIWDKDVVGAILHGIRAEKEGIYNLAGDGALEIGEMAAMMGKRTRKLPAWMVKAALAVAHPLGLSPYGPEQLKFLRYRPVLDNRKLKEAFGYVPQKSSRQVWEYFIQAGQRGQERPGAGADR